MMYSNLGLRFSETFPLNTKRYCVDIQQSQEKVKKLCQILFVFSLPQRFSLNRESIFVSFRNTFSYICENEAAGAGAGSSAGRESAGEQRHLFLQSATPLLPSHHRPQPQSADWLSQVYTQSGVVMFGPCFFCPSDNFETCLSLPTR